MPAYVNRRPAETELMKEVVRLKTLDEAFEILRSLDDPIDKYAMMQSLCRADWIPETPIDDFYYQLRQKAVHAGANLDLVFSILIAQLPKRVQGQAKDEFASQKGDGNVISESGGRKLIMKIKRIRSDRGVALDVGCKEIDNLVSNLSNIKMDTRDTDPNQISKLTDYKKGYQGYQNRKGNNNRSRKYQPLLCYICEKPGHFARDCRNQFCQRCGQKGHAMKNCNNSVSSYNVADRQLSSKDESVPEETVVIKILIEGHERNAMIDSGASSVSVIDGTTVKNSNVKITPEKCSLRAFDNSVVRSPGFVQMNIQVGSEPTNHKFKVIEAKHGKEVIVLGREFQQKFSRTVFGWEQQRVALGDQWFDTIVWIRGGNMESRISAAGQDQADSITEFDFDINPDLPEEQQDQLRELLIEFSDRFAKDTKKPTLTNVGEHVIETTPGARPVKCKKYRLSPEQEEEVKRQANKMVEDGVARPHGHTMLFL